MVVQGYGRLSLRNTVACKVCRHENETRLSTLFIFMGFSDIKITIDMCEHVKERWESRLPFEILIYNMKYSTVIVTSWKHTVEKVQG